MGGRRFVRADRRVRCATQEDCPTHGRPKGQLREPRRLGAIPATDRHRTRGRRRSTGRERGHLGIVRRRRRHERVSVEHAHSKGRHYAGRINDAIEDDVKDGWWDNVKDWVDRHADSIKLVTKVLSYVVTALAIVALFIPGVNILVAVLVLGGFLLAGQTLLAASGNGSWVDVGPDHFRPGHLRLGGASRSWAQGGPGGNPRGRSTGGSHGGQERRPALEQCRPHCRRTDPGPSQRVRRPTARRPPEHRRGSPAGPDSG